MDFGDALLANMGEFAAVQITIDMIFILELMELSADGLNFYSISLIWLDIDGFKYLPKCPLVNFSNDFVVFPHFFNHW